MEQDDIALFPSEQRVSIWTRISHPRYAIHRYIALALMSFMGFGNYFVYDIPGALQSKITEDMNLTSTAEFASLYSLYSWPNVIISLFGGFLIDRVFGKRLGAVFFASIVFGGQFVVALGALFNRFWLMQVGRFIFGLGGENLAVTGNTYAVSWFKGKELNMVFGFQLSFSRVGSTANFLITGRLYEALNKSVTGYKCLGIVLLIGTGICLFSLTSSIILGLLDKRAEKLLKRDELKSDEVIKITDIKHFSLKFWLITFICISYYVCIFPFVSLGTVFFMQKYEMSFNQADSIDGAAYLISAIASPLIGILIDFTGRNLIWVFVAVLITLASHLIFAFTLLNPWIPMVLLGLGYSVLACALWPMVSLVIPEHQLGTAYGAMQSIQNLGLAIVPLVAGFLIDFKGYIVLETFFLFCLCICILCTIVLFMNDSANEGLLNMSKKQRAERDLHKTEAEPSLESETTPNEQN
ncbi:Major facilitator superfamily domain-containing protein 1-like protein [Dinothrombium tinctorium]|uniref:Lysosomal dipeptide transporter MFSD1 n=1 Tax=Dinothrombium tinctorium TaxID=1965070 RepID=A0A3S3R269_9ACAR|nr:Major facilitator superfamily domain-containing protein 1-like protein [Dinothrombium tinctorium]RWS14293.1 Major facilitator superfamily domain-containing protein 1-like protein [Dinothrombium tinctorium]RWS17333.1 Major facilitator superfamily domain-containing protein 1-like protein [Dinothrombium tinctorium]